LVGKPKLIHITQEQAIKNATTAVPGDYQVVYPWYPQVVVQMPFDSAQLARIEQLEKKLAELQVKLDKLANHFFTRIEKLEK
jgi:hypothetical protein